MRIMVLKELAEVAKLLGVSISAARRARRELLSAQYTNLMLAATYGDAGESVRKEYKQTATDLLYIIHREEDTLYTRETAE